MQFGADLGAKGDFAGCVTGAKNAAAITAETKKAVADPALQTKGLFGTPTVVANGAMVDLNNIGLAQGDHRLTRLPSGRRRRVPSAWQGAVAQLVAHLTGSQRVRGSNPLSSTLAVTSARSEFSQVRAGV